MDAATFLTHLGHDIDRVRALPRASMDARVSACPEWDVDALLGHCAGVFSFASGNLEAGPDADLQDRPELDEAKSGAELFTAEADRLLTNLRSTDPDERRTTWAGPEPAHWYFRRMAQELAIHRWDAEHAATGSPSPIDPALAIDGIDELFDVFLLPYAKHRGVFGNGETVHLHATDLDDRTDGLLGEWLLTLTPDGADLERSHGKGDMAARGAASDLLLFAWNRRPVDLTTFGDPDILEWWPERIAI